LYLQASEWVVLDAYKQIPINMDSSPMAPGTPDPVNGQQVLPVSGNTVMTFTASHNNWDGSECIYVLSTCQQQPHAVFGRLTAVASSTTQWWYPFTGIKQAVKHSGPCNVLHDVLLPRACCKSIV
jgi:hypothetical protein